MRKNTPFIFLCSLFPIAYSATSVAATPWWQQPTICQLNPTKCYPGMGAGFDAGMWDASSNCYGMKLICPAALTMGGADPVPMPKTTITLGTGIISDFDINTLNTAEGCYGTRKVSSGGSTATVGGNSVKVYCPGVLADAGVNPNTIQTVANGEITTGAQPTCSALAKNGWVAVLNGNCYGKLYDLNDYYIDCSCPLCPAGTNTGGDQPSRIINIRAASGSFITGTGTAATSSPATQTAADSIFGSMLSTSTARKASKFNQ